jgi:hypothetical protein
MQLRYRCRIDPTPGQRQARLHGTRLDVAEVGELRVRWSRALPSVRLIRENQAVAVEDVCVAGLAETQNACGGSVSPGQPLAVASEAGTRRGAA